MTTASRGAIVGNEFYLIAVGRALLNDAGWAMKVRVGEVDALRDFTPAAFGQSV